MNKKILRLSAVSRALVVVSSALVFTVSYAQTAPPPKLGEETKGIPVIDESTPEVDVDSAASAPSSEDTVATEEETVATEEETKGNNLFGKSTVVESRRENGQVYSIELQHSNAPTQYREETNSDGNIEFESKDVEDTPNLPKWKLGSW